MNKTLNWKLMTMLIYKLRIQQALHHGIYLKDLPVLMVIKPVQ